MTNVIIFPRPKPRITKGLLCDLTARVSRETAVRDIIADYTEYCALLGINPSKKAHYDWAMERLGLTQHRALA